jgi:hypothetical protein
MDTLPGHPSLRRTPRSVSSATIGANHTLMQRMESIEHTLGTTCAVVQTMDGVEHRLWMLLVAVLVQCALTCILLVWSYFG